jgi:hypothetical protein
VIYISTIDKNDIAKEQSHLIFRISYYILKEIIYNLESGNANERANLANDLKKFIKEAKIYQNEE